MAVALRQGAEFQLADSGVEPVRLRELVELGADLRSPSTPGIRTLVRMSASDGFVRAVA